MEARTSDKLVRRTAYAAVVAISVIAALISYWHAVAVVGKHGETGYIGHLYPVTVDGLIIAASMVLLDAARNHEKPHALAWWLVGGGVFTTLGANILDGVSHGFLGSVIAAWPALAFVGAYEMIMVLVRSSARRARAAEQPASDAELRLTRADQDLLDRELDDPPRALPKLQELMRDTPEWQPDERRKFDGQTVYQGPPELHFGPPDVEQADLVRDTGPRHAAPAHAGQVRVSNPLAGPRMDRKVHVDNRAPRTGSFPTE